MADGKNKPSKSRVRQIVGTSLSNRPSKVLAVVLLVLAVAAMVIALAVYRLSVASHESGSSQISSAPNNVSGTAGQHISSQRKKLVNEADKQAAQKAKKTGQSHIATLASMSAPKATQIPTPRNPNPAPAGHTTPASHPSSSQSAQNTGSASNGTNQQDNQQDKQMQQAMDQEMTQIVNASSLHPGSPQTYQSTTSSRSNGQASSSASAGVKQVAMKRSKAASSKGASNAGSGHASGPALIPAGRLLYAQMDNRANSDVPGPVRVTILSGRFRGDYLLGKATKSRDYLKIKFDKLHTKRYGTVSVNAVALNMKHGTAGVATQVHHHWLARLGAPFLGYFLSGLGSAISQSGQRTVTTGLGTTVTNNPTYTAGQKLAIAAGKGAQGIGQRLESMSNIPTTVIENASTPIGVLFTQDVQQPAQRH